MDNLQKTIKRNLFLRVDFDGKYKKVKGKITQQVKFFLIGSLPIVIEYLDGEKERSILNVPIRVEMNPHLRLLNGAKVKDLDKIQKEAKAKMKVDLNYSKEAKEILTKMTNVINKVGNEKKFNNKEIKSIMIINISK